MLTVIITRGLQNHPGVTSSPGRVHLRADEGLFAELAPLHQHHPWGGPQRATRASAAPRPWVCLPQGAAQSVARVHVALGPCSASSERCFDIAYFQQGFLVIPPGCSWFPRCWGYSKKPPFRDARNVSRPSPAADDVGHPGPWRWPLLPP